MNAFQPGRAQERGDHLARSALRRQLGLNVIAGKTIALQELRLAVRRYTAA